MAGSLRRIRAVPLSQWRLVRISLPAPVLEPHRRALHSPKRPACIGGPPNEELRQDSRSRISRFRQAAVQPPSPRSGRPGWKATLCGRDWRQFGNGARPAVARRARTVHTRDDAAGPRGRRIPRRCPVRLSMRRGREARHAGKARVQGGRSRYAMNESRRSGARHPEEYARLPSMSVVAMHCPAGTDRRRPDAPSRSNFERFRAGARSGSGTRAARGPMTAPHPGK